MASANAGLALIYLLLPHYLISGHVWSKNKILCNVYHDLLCVYM